MKPALFTVTYRSANQQALLGGQVISGQPSQYDFQLSPFFCFGSYLKCLITQTDPPFIAKKGAQTADVFPRTVRLLRLVFIWAP